MSSPLSLTFKKLIQKASWHEDPKPKNGVVIPFPDRRKGRVPSPPPVPPERKGRKPKPHVFPKPNRPSDPKKPWMVA